MSTWVKASSQRELQEQGAHLLWLDEDWPVVLFWLAGDIFAVDARCTHQEAWLHEGEIDTARCEVICPLHHARFSLKDGNATRGPAAAPLTVYPVRLDDVGTIWLLRIMPWWR